MREAQNFSNDKGNSNPQLDIFSFELPDLVKSENGISRIIFQEDVIKRLLVLSGIPFLTITIDNEDSGTDMFYSEGSEQSMGSRQAEAFITISKKVIADTILDNRQKIRSAEEWINTFNEILKKEFLLMAKQNLLSFQNEMNVKRTVELYSILFGIDAAAFILSPNSSSLALIPSTLLLSLFVNIGLKVFHNPGHRVSFFIGPQIDRYALLALACSKFGEDFVRLETISEETI